jgi:hypothetical protein
MDHDTTLVRLFVSGPTDVEPYRRIAATAVHVWNHTYCGSASHCHVDLVNWYPPFEGGFGKAPQSYINPTVDSCDLLFAIFWTRLGTETPSDKSGTVEEINRFIDACKADFTCIFYCDRSPEAPYDAEQLAKVQAYLAEIGDKCFIHKFESDSDFALTFLTQLTYKVRRLVPKPTTTTTTTEDVNRGLPPHFTDADISTILTMAGARPRLAPIAESFRRRWTVELEAINCFSLGDLFAQTARALDDASHKMPNDPSKRHQMNDLCTRLLSKADSIRGRGVWRSVHPPETEELEALVRSVEHLADLIDST